MKKVISAILILLATANIFAQNIEGQWNGVLDIQGTQLRIVFNITKTATGYQPNFSFLEKIGIELSQDGKFYPKYNPETQETNLKGIYLAGVVCGGMDPHVWFIENSRVHAETIIEHIEISKKLFF